MMILGIETSGPIGSLALRHHGRCLEERFLPELSQRHAQSLVIEIQALIRSQQVAPGSLDAIAVSVGPGGFTGLRVGVTCAKTLAYATGVALVAVDTFQAIAENFPNESHVAVIADAQRRGVILGLFERASSGQMERLAPLTVIPKQGFPEKIPPAALLAGWGVDPLIAHLESGTNSASPRHHLRVAPAALRFPRASVIAQIGEYRLHRGLQDDPLTLEPHYAQRSAAEEQWDQRAMPPR